MSGKGASGVRAKKSDIEVSVILPCRNEQEFIAQAVLDVRRAFDDTNRSYEIIVSDSSNDNSAKRAKRAGARIVAHGREGYGIALREGISASRGRYIAYADPDGTYDLSVLPTFIDELEGSTQLVIGNRFGGTIHKNAMPPLHRFIGTPVSNLLIRFLTGVSMQDVQSGMRAIRRVDYEKLGMSTTGMEYASEMVAKAIRHDFLISHIDIDYHPRIGESKLRTWQDGWRHLRFLILFNPVPLALLPGFVFFVFGTAALILLYMTDPVVGGITFYVHPMFLASLLCITGYQLILFSLYMRTYAYTHLGHASTFLDRFYRIATLERGLLVALTSIVLGASLFGAVTLEWFSGGRAALQAEELFVIALTLVVVGILTIFSALMISMLGIKTK